ncbi:hypothetical protein [Adhaeribacter radiodurans]|uniref:Uncharacterized protein n=1 Tax=Adhaeribacter radiodurans TaxID=2745197 RepID=A0A7L7LAI7_9BACT|nr:hypothetical protein [Adhaeribacter radiodurans]QMU29852.1 hypothetical protein HUW48_18290 [Adhaeribacter radiodurans]
MAGGPRLAVAYSYSFSFTSCIIKEKNNDFNELLLMTRINGIKLPDSASPLSKF